MIEPIFLLEAVINGNIYISMLEHIYMVEKG